MLDAAIELIGRMKADIVYEIGATTVTTTPPMSFALRRGVCQDFAHIMISGLRGIGLPAAYVSGYLRSAPRTDPTRLQGADAMHAWVLLWCGSAAGWIGLDPDQRDFGGRGPRHARDRPRLHRRRADGRRDPGLGRATHRRCCRRDAGRLIALDPHAPVAVLASAASAAARRPVTSVTPAAPWRCAIQPGSL